MESLLNFQGRQSLHSNTGEALELPDLSRSNARQSIVQTFIDATCLAGYVAHASICFDLFLCISWTGPPMSLQAHQQETAFTIIQLANSKEPFCFPRSMELGKWLLSSPKRTNDAWKLVASTSKTNSWTSFPTGERCAGSPAFKKFELTDFNLNQSNEFPKWSTCTN